MERELWPLLYHLLQETAKGFRQKYVTYQPWVLAAVHLWAALHDRTHAWACQQRHWSTTRLRPATLPSRSTLSRRMHTVATGLFLHAAYGEEDNNGKKTLAGFTEPDSQQWYVKGGIRRQWMPLGHTVLYGEAGTYIDQMGPVALNAGATSSEFTRWGVGAVQEIDAASMSIWLKYREHAAEVTGFAPAGIDDFRYVSTGAIINF